MIQKIQDAETLLKIDEVQLILSVLQGGKDMTTQIDTVIGQFRNIYDEATATWKPWCAANLTANEKNQMINAMQKLQAIKDYFNN